MGILTFILGGSGTGKSTSIKGFNPDEIGIINVQGKILPFRNSGKYEVVNTDDSDVITRTIEGFSKKYKSVVVDDFQYVMSNEFMRRVTERGYDKFSEIARHAWDIAECVRKLPPDIIVYIMCHTDRDADGFEKLKTIGRLLDEKIVLEGMATIVLKTAVSDGQYMFLTQNNGKDTAKSPAGMFPTYAIDNNLKYVDDKIRNYYGIGDAPTDEEMKEADAEAAKPEVEKGEKKKRGRKAKEKEQSETLTEEAETETGGARASFEKAKRRRIAREPDTEAVATENGALNDPAIDEELPFSDPVAETPTRKERDPDPEPEQAEEVKPTRRRGRRKKVEE